MVDMAIASISFTLFIIMNSFGLIPPILDLLKDKSPQQKTKIIIREMVIALLVILAFNYLGEFFFIWLDIPQTSIQMAGGLILFLISLQLIFPSDKKSIDLKSSFEPFIVPLAVPLIASPSLLMITKVLSSQEPSLINMFIAIIIAWSLTLIVFLLSPQLQKLVGDKGLTAFQRLMGLLLTLIAVQMFLKGLIQFVSTTFFAEI
jgi:multiple antibiotic resistance protein